MGDRIFTILLETEVGLTIDQLWPDGDAPENPTVDDVHALIKASGGAEQVLSDWSLGPLQVTVSTYPPVKSTDGLPPEWNNTPSIGTEDLWSRTERQAETAENRRGWAEALRNGDDCLGHYE